MAVPSSRRNFLWSVANGRRLYATSPFSHDRERCFLDRTTIDVARRMRIYVFGHHQTLSTEHGERRLLVSKSQVGLHLDHLVSPDLLGRCVPLSPGFPIKLVPRNGILARAFAPYCPQCQGNKTFRPERARLKPQRLCRHFPNVWLSTLVTSMMRTLCPTLNWLFSS